jgi:hypothetical protein
MFEAKTPTCPKEVSWKNVHIKFKSTIERRIYNLKA